jgi:hypothetical protein
LLGLVLDIVLGIVLDIVLDIVLALVLGIPLVLALALAMSASPPERERRGQDVPAANSGVLPHALAPPQPLPGIIAGCAASLP